MARLLVFRGDFVEREVELGVTPIRLGRAPECDIVLDDPERGVSRAHAEVRYDGSGYLVVDLGSQNGIHQYGARVDRAYLEADSPINLGPFRLVLDETEGAAAAGETSAIQDSRYPPPARRGHDRGGYDEEDDLEDSRAGRSRHGGAQPWWRTHAKTLWLGGAAVLVAGGLGLTQVLTPRGPSDEERLMQHLAAARALIEQLEPQRAITEHLDPALAIDGTNVDAIDLKVRAQEQVDRMAATARSSDAGGTSAASTSGGSKEARASGAGGTTTAVAPVASSPAARATPPAPERSPDAQYRAQIDQAKQLRDSGQLLAAEKLLESVIRDAGAGFADAKATLDAIRQRRIQEGQRLFREATDDAANERWDEAIAKYTRAQTVDPTLIVTSQLEEVQRKKLDAALAKYKEAEVARKYGSNAEALRLYEQIIKLLPTSHPLYADVEKKIKELKK